MIRIRPAPHEEVDSLTALCVRSKAYWGYDAEFMRQTANVLAVTAAMIEKGCVLVAENEHSELLGVAAVEATQVPGKFDLSLLFVEPPAMGTGVGLTLFEAAARLAERQGGSSLSILAAAFYQHLGAMRVGQAPSDAIPGRFLPLLDYEISPSPC